MSDFSGTPKSVRSFTYEGGYRSIPVMPRGQVDEKILVSDLEEGNQYKFLGVLQTAKKEENMSLECAAKEFLRRCLSSGQVPCLITTV